MLGGKRWRSALTLLLFWVGASTTDAQEVEGAFGPLRSRVKVGDTIIVTDVTGQETTGKITALSGAALEVSVDGARRSFSEATVATISRRDSLWNGILWGLGVGAVLGASAEKSFADEYGRDDIGYGSVVAPFAAAGGAIGLAVDAIIKGRQILYVGSGSGNAAKLVTFRPAWNQRRKGISATLRF
jgi:hypothetical protein